MSFNLLQSAKDLFNNDVVTRLSSFLGETEASTQKAVEASLPVVGMGVFDKVKTSGGADFLLNFIRGNSSDFLHGLSETFDSSSPLLSRGERILEGLFGNKIRNVSNAVGRYAGVSDTTASGILAMVGSVIMGVLGRHADQSNLTPNGLSSLLTGQSSMLSGFVPAGFSNYLGSLGLGSSATGATIPNRTAATSSAATLESAPASSNRWLWPLLLVLIGAALWYFLGSKGCNGNDKMKATDTTATVTTMPDTTKDVVINTPKGRVDTATGDYIYDVGNITALTLPGGAVINVGENSTEAKLVRFLNDANAVVDTAKGNWFEFTGVRFKTASAQLSDSSLQQLKNFAAIAKAYPKAQFKIGGYTDNTGPESANVTLSQKRADAVYAKSLSLGVAKSALTGAKGYGPAYPIGDNSTAEGKAINRRVAINVKAK